MISILQIQTIEDNSIKMISVPLWEVDSDFFNPWVTEIFLVQL